MNVVKKESVAQRVWRSKNKDYVQKYNSDYRKKNKKKLNEYSKKRYTENKEHQREIDRKWIQKNPISRLVSWAKQRAKQEGLYFDLKVKDVPPIPEICPVALIPICSSVGNKGPRDNSPSLDKVDNSKGYVSGNVRVISYKANRWKSDMSLADVERLVQYMKGFI